MDRGTTGTDDETDGFRGGFISQSDISKPEPSEEDVATVCPKLGEDSFFLSYN